MNNGETRLTTTFVIDEHLYESGNLASYGIERSMMAVVVPEAYGVVVPSDPFENPKGPYLLMSGDAVYKGKIGYGPRIELGDKKGKFFMAATLGGIDLLQLMNMQGYLAGLEDGQKIKLNIYKTFRGILWGYHFENENPIFLDNQNLYMVKASK